MVIVSHGNGAQTVYMHIVANYYLQLGNQLHKVQVIEEGRFYWVFQQDHIYTFEIRSKWCTTRPTKLYLLKRKMSV